MRRSWASLPSKSDNALLNELFSLMAREGVTTPRIFRMLSHTGATGASSRRCGIRLSISAAFDAPVSGSRYRARLLGPMWMTLRQQQMQRVNPAVVLRAGCARAIDAAEQGDMAELRQVT